MAAAVLVVLAAMAVTITTETLRRHLCPT